MKSGNVWLPPSSKEVEDLLKGLRTEEGESYIGRASRLLGMENGRKRVLKLLNGNAKMNRAEYKYFYDIVNGEQ